MASTIGQIDGLQLLRAVAVALVVLCHSGQVLGNIGVGGLPDVGAFGIDIFFVISGFILSLATLKDLRPAGVRSMWLFMKRRFIRIYPIYWVIALLTLTRITLAGQLRGHNYLPAFFLLPAPFHPFIFTYSWTMMFEVFFYLLLGLTLLKTIKNAVPVLIGILTLFVLIGAFITPTLPVWGVASNPILLEFVFGAIIALVYARIGRRRNAGILFTFVGVAIAILVRVQDSPKIANGFQMLMLGQGAFARVFTWGISAALIVGGVIFWSPSMDSLIGRWAVLIGNASYSGYLVSALVLEFATRLYFKVTIPSTGIASRTLYQGSMIAIDLAIGLGCYLLIEKPMLQFLQDKLLRRKALPITPLPSMGHAIPASPFSITAAMPGKSAPNSPVVATAPHRLNVDEPSDANLRS